MAERREGWHERQPRLRCGALRCFVSWKSVLRAGLLGLLALAPAPALTQSAPEPATGRTLKQAQTSPHDMVAAANPLAAEAGRAVLAEGGSAVDAAIATQFVLNLVEPQSSGIGGGAFLVFWDGRDVTTLDGREAAPAAAKPDRFLGPDGKTLKFYDAVVGGRSVGVPGTLRLLEDAHRRWGKLPWPRLLEPAIRIAEDGFPLSPRLHGLLAQEEHLAGDPLARALFFQPNGTPKPVGTVLKNPAFGQTLRAIAAGGADAFYTGAIAADIVATVAGHPANPGDMTLGDLKSYRVEERAPVCGPYREYRICGMGPPSSGGIAVLQIMSVLQTRDMAAMGLSADAAHWMAEAGRLAFADRALFVGDPAFVDVPVKGLIDPGYLRARAALVRPERSMVEAKAGDPPPRCGSCRTRRRRRLRRGTRSFGRVDRRPWPRPWNARA